MGGPEVSSSACGNALSGGGFMKDMGSADGMRNGRFVGGSSGGQVGLVSSTSALQSQQAMVPSNLRYVVKQNPDGGFTYQYQYATPPAGSQSTGGSGGNGLAANSSSSSNNGNNPNASVMLQSTSGKPIAQRSLVHCISPRASHTYGKLGMLMNPQTNAMLPNVTSPQLSVMAPPQTLVTSPSCVLSNGDQVYLPQHHQQLGGLPAASAAGIPLATFRGTPLPQQNGILTSGGSQSDLFSGRLINSSWTLDELQKHIKEHYTMPVVHESNYICSPNSLVEILPDAQQHAKITIRPRVDAYLDPKQPCLLLLVDLPGFAKHEVQVEVEDELLSISGERSFSDMKERYGDELAPLIQERQFGYFYRVFKLPPNAIRNTVTATMMYGLLEVKIACSTTASDKLNVPVYGE